MNTIHTGDKRRPATDGGDVHTPLPVLVFWSVNGIMDAEEVRTQLQEFAEKGIGGVFLHSRAGRKIDYLGAQWEEFCRISIAEAERCGLQIWLYDEDGWPSGFAGGLVPRQNPAYCIKRMGFARVLPPNTELLAAYQKTDEGMQRCEAGQIAQADWVCYFERDPHYADLLNPDAVRLFIDSTYEWYKKRFGSAFSHTIQGIFTDEPQMNGGGYTWNEALAARYAAGGRDIREDLWRLYVGDDAQTRAFRRTYIRLLNEQFQESYVAPISAWCAANGLQFTGHFAGEDGLTGQPRLAGDVMTHYPAMQIPAIDHLGRRIASPVLFRQVSSIGNQYGKEYLLSETFGCSGWNTPMKEYLWIWQCQASHGINLPCLHLSAYSIKGVRKRDYPLFFSYQNNWWDGMNAFTDAMEAISSFIPRKAVKNQVLVVSPFDGVCYNMDRPRAANLSAQFRVLIENLLDNQIDFDIGDPWVMEQDARVEQETLCIGAGRYSLVLVAQTDYLTPRVEKLLAQFAGNGGRLVLINEYGNAAVPDFGRQLTSQAIVFSNRRRLLSKYFRSIGYTRPVEVIHADGTLAEGLVVRYDQPVTRIQIWSGDSSDVREVYVVTQGENRLHRWDFNAACFTELVDTVYTADKTYTRMRLEPFENPLLTVEPGRCTDTVSVPLQSEKLANWRVQLLDRNVLTLDTCRYKVNGSDWMPSIPVIRTHQAMYEMAAAVGGECEAWYAFTFDIADDFEAFDTVTLCVEDSADGIQVNGQEISLTGDAWYVDKCIREYPVGAFLQAGRNTVQIRYTIHKTDGFTSVKGIFETERNRFFFEKEPESIYLRGTFDVHIDGEIDKELRYYSVNARRFELRPATPKIPQDITAQDAWFYRGRVAYTMTLESTEKPLILRFPELDAPYAEIEVNGERVGRLVSPPFAVTLTPYLTKPVNEVTVVLYSSNRNMLGPHHHICGELDFVGVSSFKGEKGFEDFVNSEVVSENTWSDRYSFCPLQLGTVVKESGGIGR